MSYSKKIEYEIIPKESFLVIRSCSGCGKKVHYQNTNKFRVNANGNKLDVWLIYQCEKCKHTLNLTIYERQKAVSIPKEEYMQFLNNDEQLAEEYGRNLQFFERNKAEIEFGAYCFVKRHETEGSSENQQVRIAIRNPYGLKLRPEKQIAEALGLSRSSVKRQIEQEKIIIETASPQLLSFAVEKSQIF
ncbi:MAG: DUF1062 domain-containing protein [Lachnospiraceae bacterium]|nr:DUF1062 domain-containing protein [Lachnospiraceae bacterium]